MKTKSFGITDIGKKRRNNQDAFLCDDEMGLYIVADGMGGHKGGEVASQLAVETLQQYCHEHRQTPPVEILSQGINLACEKIFQQSQQSEELQGMGTTISALLVRDGTAHVGQVGDSRAYLLSPSGIWQVTEDHSLVNEEIRSGRLTVGRADKFQFKNVITRSVGYESEVVVDLYRRKLEPNDVFLLCSDGLSGMVAANEMAEILEAKGLEEGLQRLVDLALSRGGDDNITGVICYIDPT